MPSDLSIPDLEKLFTDDPFNLTREDVMATLPTWRQARAKFMLTPPAPTAKATLKKPLDISSLGLLKK